MTTKEIKDLLVKVVGYSRREATAYMKKIPQEDRVYLREQSGGIKKTINHLTFIRNLLYDAAEKGDVDNFTYECIDECLAELRKEVFKKMARDVALALVP